MKRILILLTFFSFSISSNAQDLFAGEITYRWISGNIYEIKLSIFTQTSANINRDTIFIDLGDGTMDTIIGTCNSSGNDISKCIYVITHDYPGPGIYIISFLDSFRVDNIHNIPNSGSTSMYLETQLYINAFGNINSSSINSWPLVSNAISGMPYQYSSGTSDPDGDSLIFSLAPIAGAYIPANIGINSTTGLFTWNNPDTIGYYVFAILTEEFRHGQKIGSVTREIMVEITTSPLSIDSIIYIQPTDTTTCDGQIQLFVSGGCVPYSIDWNDFLFNPYTACCAVYPFSIIDACGNTISDTAYLGCPTSITDSKISQKITVTPNPFHDNFTVIIPANQTAALTIYNLFGQTIFQSFPFGQQIPIDFSSQPDGIYFLKEVISGQTQTFKIIKL